MSVTLMAFLAKVVFFVAYVAAAIRVVGLPAQAFGLSFVAWFLVLYAAQAVLLVRLFRDGVKGARRSAQTNVFRWPRRQRRARPDPPAAVFRHQHGRHEARVDAVGRGAD